MTNEFTKDRAAFEAATERDPLPWELLDESAAGDGTCVTIRVAGDGRVDLRDIVCEPDYAGKAIVLAVNSYLPRMAQIEELEAENKRLKAKIAEFIDGELGND